MASLFQAPTKTAWYRKDPRSSPVGLIGLAASVVSASVFALDLYGNVWGLNAMALKDAAPNWHYLITIFGSSTGILLCLFSLGLEKAVLAPLVGLVIIVAVENILVPAMPIWTWMFFLRWKWTAVAYPVLWLIAIVLIAARILRRIGIR